MNKDFGDIHQEIKNLCRQYGYKTFTRFDQIHIITRCEAWYFVPSENGIIKLMHGNSLGQIQNGYHKQFSRKMTYEEMFIYIHEHECSKYSLKKIDFTFTKTGAKKRMAVY